MSGESTKITCFFCGKPLAFPPGNVGRGETCDNCRSDVRVCLNCRHYDKKAYNECNEPQAERVVDKDKRNFCDYFFLAPAEREKSERAKESILKDLDALFKK